MLLIITRHNGMTIICHCHSDHLLVNNSHDEPISSFDLLQSAMENTREWVCDVQCKGYSIEDQSQLKEYNICKFLVPAGHTCDTTWNSSFKPRIYSNVEHWNRSNFKFDQSEFLGTHHRHKIKQYIIKCCQSAGFQVEAKVRLAPHIPNELPPPTTCTIRFRCIMNKTPISELKVKSEGKNHFLQLT